MNLDAVEEEILAVSSNVIEHILEAFSEEKPLDQGFQVGRIWAQALRVIQYPKTSGFELGVDGISDFLTAFGNAGPKRSEEK